MGRGIKLRCLWLSDLEWMAWCLGALFVTYIPYSVRMDTFLQHAAGEKVGEE